MSSEPSDKFLALLQYFEQNIVQMEDKVNRLESEIQNVAGDREQVESFKNEFMRLGDAEEKNKEQIKSLFEQVRILQTENQELLDEIKDKNEEVETYRKKYLITLDRYEEQSCELISLKTKPERNNDLLTHDLEFKNDLLSKQLTQLQDLPLELKAKQIEIDEVRSALKVRENTIDALARDLETCILQSEKLTSEVQDERAANKNLLTEIWNLRQNLDEVTESNKELSKQRQITERQNKKIIELEETIDQKQKELDMFEQQLSLLREESAKQIIRIKERAETHRNSLQLQISGLEKELAHTRAALKAAAKDRDDTRHRLKAEIMKLESKFNEAQLEVHHLRGNIDLLKRSYSSIAAALVDEDSPRHEPDMIKSEEMIRNEKNLSE